MFCSDSLCSTWHWHLALGSWIPWISVFSGHTLARHRHSLCCTVKYGHVDTLCCWGDLLGVCVLRFGLCRHWHTHLGLLRQSVWWVLTGSYRLGYWLTYWMPSPQVAMTTIAAISVPSKCASNWLTIARSAATMSPSSGWAVSILVNYFRTQLESVKNVA